MKTIFTRDAIAREIADGVKTFADISVRTARAWARRSTKPTEEMKERVRSVLGDDAASGRLVEFVISTERRAADGFTVRSDGWMLDRYRENPVILDNHRWYAPVIGHSVVYVDEKERELRAVAAFLPRDLSEIGYQVGEVAARRGYAASVGFNIKRAVPSPSEVTAEIPWALDILEAELLEWSTVSIPSDSGASSRGNVMSVLQEAVAMADTQRMDRDELFEMWRRANNKERQPAKQLLTLESARAALGIR